MHRITARILLLALCLFLAAAGAAQAAQGQWPDKPITLISPFGAGGDSDLTARVWAEFAKSRLGQPVVVVNKTGGGGVVGSLFAARAKPDGYTLFLAQAGPNIIVPMTAKGADYGFDSFDYIARIMLANCAVVARPDAPWKDLKAFAEAAQKAPGTLVFASPAANSWLTFAMRNWFNVAGVKVKIVEYKSGGEAATAIMGGHADMTFLFPQNYAAMAKAGQLKILAIGFKSETFPDAPTFADLGYSGNYYGWAGIAAPKGTPAPILERLAQVSEEIVKDPGYIKVIENMGATPNFATGEAWMSQLREQYAEMERVLDSLGLNQNKK
ncbi:MAG: tripartite tricarboxylate transporter substrate binding protein [Desulfovibrio sp.]|nr:tripartite tricarboxylate transporter substrate binding protein [Desulfovibrio sp.]